MRGLCRLTASLLALVRASTFVLPQEDAVDRLHDAARDNSLAPGQNSSPNDDVGLDIGTIDLTKNNALSAHDHADDNDEKDLVPAWLDGLESSETSTGSILSASLFPTTTLSSAIEFIASTAVDVAETPYPSASTETPQSSCVPWDWHAFANGEQKILGGLEETWRVATSKVHSVVALLGNHNSLSSTASSTQAHPEGTTSVTSTISARSVEVTPTARPVQPADVHDEIEDSTGSPPANKVAIDSPVSVLGSDATNYAITASPAHFTGSSSVATATAAVIPPTNADYTPTPLAGQETQDGPSEISAVSASSDPRYVLAIVIPIILTILLSGTIFCILIRRNPRRLAESRARCEERKTRRLYEHAARKHQIRAWKQQTLLRAPFKWFVRRRQEDLAEKGLLEAESTVSNSTGPSTRVSQEIASFREAHDFVSSLVQAEEGGWSSRDRRRTYMWLFGGRARRQRAMSNASSDLSDGEKSAPPPYEERENYEKIETRAYNRVAVRDDAQDSDRSSVSSIIPTSPKHSTFTFSTGDPDSDKE